MDKQARDFSSLSAQPVPAGSPPQEPEDSPSEMFVPIEGFKKIKSFWNTRRAVLHDVPIYDYPPSQRQKEGFLGPWKFNVVQSSIAALPGALYSASKHFLGVPDTATTTEDKLLHFLIPAAVPFILMVTAYLVGRVSLASEDANPANRQRASRIFLYLDGAYGFFPQLFWSTALNIDYAFGATIVVALLVSFWQLAITMRTIPKKLFTILGYTSPSRNVPVGFLWLKYWVCIWFIGPLTGLTAIWVSAAVANLTISIARSVISKFR